MIQQHVKLATLKTDDGHFNFEDTHIQIGLDFWINCNSFRMVPYVNKETGARNSRLMVETEAGTLLPAEILEYSNDFQVKQ